MGIDGIGKPGGIKPGAIEGIEGGATEVDSATGDFSLNQVGETQQAEASSALGQLERGEISLDEYLNGRVEGAVAHLNGKLSTEQLDFVKEQLREQLSSDPVLSELVRRATGQQTSGA